MHLAIEDASNVPCGPVGPSGRTAWETGRTCLAGRFRSWDAAACDERSHLALAKSSQQLDVRLRVSGWATKPKRGRQLHALDGPVCGCWVGLVVENTTQRTSAADGYGYRRGWSDGATACLSILACTLYIAAGHHVQEIRKHCESLSILQFVALERRHFVPYCPCRYVCSGVLGPHGIQRMFFFKCFSCCILFCTLFLATCFSIVHLENRTEHFENRLLFFQYINMKLCLDFVSETSFREGLPALRLGQPEIHGLVEI